MRLLTNAQYENLVTRSAQADVLALHVEHLREDVKRLTQQVDKERLRAERAIDAQLAVRGFPTVTPREGMPDLPDELTEDPEKVNAVEARILAGDASVFTERF